MYRAAASLLAAAGAALYAFHCFDDSPLFVVTWYVLAVIPVVILGAIAKRMFGSRSEVDPIRHLIGSAILWGGLPEKDALYLNITPDNNDGAAVYKLNVQDVPVDGFWSITVYNAKGYLEPNQYNAYSLNNITAKKNVDGSVAVQFGGCDGKISNCLPTMAGWNYMVRFYRPRAEVLSGTWKFPEAQRVN